MLLKLNQPKILLMLQIYRLPSEVGHVYYTSFEACKAEGSSLDSRETKNYMIWKSQKVCLRVKKH